MVENPAAEPQNTPYPQQRTPEQHAAVRRRSLPIAIAGLICGIAGLILILTTRVDAAHPPNVLAVNLSFCAMMMGIGIFFYTRGTPGTRPAALLCVLAILIGLAGPLVYARQSVQWHGAIEGGEMANLRTIALAAGQYARDNGGAYPANLEVLLDQGRLHAEDLHSPFSSEETGAKRKDAALGKISAADFDKWYARASDYDYFGQDLRIPATGAIPNETIIAASKSPIMGTNLGVGWADGRAALINLEETEAALKVCNEARSKLGLPALQPPASVERARAAATRQ